MFYLCAASFKSFRSFMTRGIFLLYHPLKSTGSRRVWSWSGIFRASRTSLPRTSSSTARRTSGANSSWLAETKGSPIQRSRT
uniref:Uncharacterized protein n=1 Tax=Anguilla anguilla TaxID=7936 RepID=A0A0E9WNK2_ANGAN